PISGLLGLVNQFGPILYRLLSSLDILEYPESGVRTALFRYEHRTCLGEAGILFHDLPKRRHTNAHAREYRYYRWRRPRPPLRITPAAARPFQRRRHHPPGLRRPAIHQSSLTLNTSPLVFWHAQNIWARSDRVNNGISDHF